MILQSKSSGALVLRLMVGLALLGLPRVGSAQGTWSVISPPGQLTVPSALAVDGTGNLYVAEVDEYDGYPYRLYGVSRIQKRDAQGKWSVIATKGTAPGQVNSVSALAVDTAGDLYVADASYNDGVTSTSRIQKRDAQGNWSVIATQDYPFYPGYVALAADNAGNLYVINVGGDGSVFIWAQGNWGDRYGPFESSFLGVALAVDAAGNLYVAIGASNNVSFIVKRDAQGGSSVIADYGDAIGQVDGPQALAADAAGNLYVADYSNGSRIQKRDAQGHWSVIASYGSAVGQVSNASGLAVDAAGNLYVADTVNSRVQMYTLHP